MPTMNVKAIRTRVFVEDEDLITFTRKYVPKLKDGSVLVITSKIVALSEGRTAVIRNEKEREKLIRSESDSALKTKYVWLTMKDGIPMANAGIDDSNGNGKLILLPKDSFKSAQTLRKELKRVYKIKDLGVIITDSRVMPLRAGVVGVALGYAGFKGIRDYRKQKDIFGRPFAYTSTDIADSLATAAVVEMGEGNERQPLAIITEASLEFQEKVDRKELRIGMKDDMYRPLFARRL
jgi:coenzyme F420-0:L-glutamate ligase